MEELKIIPPYPLTPEGIASFPASEERPEGVISVDWRDTRATPPVDVRANIVYQELDGEKQHIQLFTPGQLPEIFGRSEGEPKPFPLIVYIPGSAWHRQNPWQGLDRAIYFAGRGFAFAIVEYRPTEIGAVYPAQREDAKSAIRFLKEHAGEYNIDTEKIAIWGDSSGGHTAVHVAIDSPSLVRCCVNWFGPTDIAKMGYYPSAMEHGGPDTPEGFLIGQKHLDDYPELAQAINPITHITAERDVAPILILHGTRDMIVPFNQSVRLYEKLRECNKDVTFYRLEGADHGFRGFASNEAYDLTLEFIKKYL